ncbi:DUF6215 domain-containing protein [Kitasatospora purpeofusca]|uniref:DUF6215 domain-containing protein n=1 Tax=Kitasatospora purpeofusca TaxID=67352 RepID=UPI0036774745
MPAARKSGRNTAAKVGAMLLAATGLGAWMMLDRTDQEQDQDRPSAACAAPRPTDRPNYAALCAALNRPDLPALLGTPQGRVLSAGPAVLAFGTDATVEVRLGTSVVSLTDSSATVADVADTPEFRPRPTTVLGHGALTYTTSTVTLGAGVGPQTLFVHDIPGATPSRVPTLPGWVGTPPDPSGPASAASR